MMEKINKKVNRIYSDDEDNKFQFCHLFKYFFISVRYFTKFQ